MGAGLIIGGIAAGVGIAGQITAARQQADAIRAQQDAAARSLAINTQGVLTRGARTAQQLFRRGQQVRGTLRARGAEAGIGTTVGTFAALMRNIGIQEQEQEAIIEENVALNIGALRAGTPRIPDPPNPWLTGALAIVGGLGTGLQIGTNISRIETDLQGGPAIT